MLPRAEHKEASRMANRFGWAPKPVAPGQSRWSYSQAEREEAILTSGRPAPWVRRAMSNTLPPSAHGAAAYVGRKAVA